MLAKFCQDFVLEELIACNYAVSYADKDERGYTIGKEIKLGIAGAVGYDDKNEKMIYKDEELFFEEIIPADSYLLPMSFEEIKTILCSEAARERIDPLAIDILFENFFSVKLASDEDLDDDKIKMILDQTKKCYDDSVSDLIKNNHSR